MKYTAAQIQTAMNTCKPQPYVRKEFVQPFGSQGECQIHRGKSKTIVNGVCQACSYKGWNTKKVQDFLSEQRAKRNAPRVTTNLVK